MSHIFVSYSRKDLDIAEKVVNALTKDNLEPWIDWKSIPKGETFEIEIQRGIEEADIFLFLVSPNSVQSDWCNKEIAHAVKNGKRILPIVISDADPEVILPEISKRNWIFCREGMGEFNRAIEETRKTIHTDYDWLKYHTELQVKAIKWKQKKDASRLLRGKELREAEQQLTEISNQEDPQPTKLQHEFILASQRNEIHTRRQITIGLVAGLVIMTALSFAAWKQRSSALEAQNLANEKSIESSRQSEIAFGNQIAAQSQAISGQYPQRSLLLAIEAYNMLSKIEGESLQNVEDTLRISLDNISGEPIQNSDLPGWLKFENVSVRQQVEVPFEFDPNASILTVPSPSGNWLAVSSSQRLGESGFQIQLWDKELNGPIILAQGKTLLVVNITFSPSGKWLVVGMNNGEIFLWNVEPLNEQPIILEGHLDSISAALISNDDRWLITGGEDNAIIIRDLTSPDYAITATLKGFDSAIQGFSINEENTLLAAKDFGGQIRIWELPPKNNFVDPWILRNKGNFFSIISAVFTHDNQFLVTSGGGGGSGEDFAVRVWDMTAIDPLSSPIVLDGHTSQVGIVALSSNDRWLLTQGTSDARETILWDLQTVSSDPQYYLLDVADMYKNEYIEGEVALFTKDGKHLIYIAQNIIQIWDLEEFNFSTPIIIENVADGSWNAEVSQDGRWLIVINQNDVKLIDLSTPENGPIIDLTKQEDSFDQFVFSKDSRWLIGKSQDNGLLLWDLAGLTDEFTPVKVAASTDIQYIQGITPDAKWLIYSDKDNSLHARDLLSGSDVTLLVAQKSNDLFCSNCSIYSEMSNAGRWLAARFGYGTEIHLWELEDDIPSTHRLLTKHEKDISVLSFSEDDRWLLSGDYKGVAFLWDLESAYLETIPATFSGPTEENIYVAEFSSDNQWIVLAGSGGDARVWHLPQSLSKIGCAVVGRNFTQIEWAQYFPEKPYRLTCPQWPIGE